MNLVTLLKIAAGTLRDDSGIVLAAHPRLMLDDSTMAALTAEYTNDTALWQAYSGFFDNYIGGTVNPVDGNKYPDPPDIGEGYQGISYFNAMFGCGLCYHVMKADNPSTAADYAEVAVNVLMQMAAATSYVSRDDGYGTRWFGVGMAIGYDWLFDLLDSTQRETVYEAINTWIVGFENGSFEYDHPQSNYFAGYFFQKAVGGLATYEQNPDGPTHWRQWRDNEFGTRVQPYYNANLVGGGWPEGFGYGALATLNMSLALVAVKTATGVDLFPQMAWAADMADYLMYATWPSMTMIDDRDMLHDQGSVDPVMFSQVQYILNLLSDDRTDVFRKYRQTMNAIVGYNEATAPSGGLENYYCYNILFHDPGTDVVDIDTLPLSYIATGMNTVFARSDWSTSANWVSFRAGHYVNNPAQGEQLHDQGSLAIVVGGTPMLVNSWGWAIRGGSGSVEDALYTDYNNNGEMWNIFYVSDGSTRFGQLSSYEAETSTVMEDGDDYVYVKATKIEDMYFTFSGTPAVVSWTREWVYLRPNRFIVCDRTVSGNASWDQWMAWHVSAEPNEESAPTGQNILSVTYDSTYLGSIITILPADATVDISDLLPTASPGVVTKVKVIPGSTATNQTWLTAFDVASTVSDYAMLDSVNCVACSMTGADGDSAVAFADSDTCSYAKPGFDAHNVVVGLTPNTGFDVDESSTNVSISPGSTYTSSALGVIEFDTEAIEFGLTGTLPGGIVGVPYSHDLTLVGNYETPVTAGLDSGSLPSWMTPTTGDGVINYAGMPDAAGTTAFTPKATDSTSPTAKVAIGSAQSVTIEAVVIEVTGSIGDHHNVGDAVTGSYSASGGTPPYTYSTTGTLPTGLTINTDGTREGTYSAAIEYDFTVTATDDNSNTGDLHEEGEVTTATYATLFDPSAYGITISNGGLTLTTFDGGSATTVIESAMVEASTANNYFECTISAWNEEISAAIGMAQFGYSSAAPGQNYNEPPNSVGMGYAGVVYINGSVAVSTGLAFSNGDTVKFHLLNGDLYVGTVADGWYEDPIATGLSGMWGPAGGSGGPNTYTSTFNFGASPWIDTPPSGAAGWTTH